MSIFLTAVLLSMTQTACGGDDNDPEDPTDPDKPTVVDPDKPVEDPASTVTVNILNDGTSLPLGNEIFISMDAANNLCATGGGNELVNVGKVAGLGNIINIPTVGWKRKAVLEVGQGYVVRYSYLDYHTNTVYVTYARIYVVGLLTSELGGIMGAQIKYQCPFQLPIKLSSKTVSFDADGDGLLQTITLLNPTQCNVKETPDWLKVVISDVTVQMTAAPNVTAESRKGTVTLSNDEGDVQIEVTQRASSNPDFTKGSGTDMDPYQIASAQQLDNVRKYPEAHFIQTADIDLSSYISSTGNGWNSIENFSGSYNGKMHKITGLWINKATTEGIGLFSGLSGNARIESIILELAEKGITGKYSVGAIAGRADRNCKIYQCNVKGNVSGKDDTGGLVGRGYYMSISQCKMEGNVSAVGIATGIGNGPYCENCYVIGTLSGSSRYAFSSQPATQCYMYDTGENISEARGTHVYYWRAAEPDSRMYLQATYEGWDFTTIWRIDNGETLPTLRCFK